MKRVDWHKQCCYWSYITITDISRLEYFIWYINHSDDNIILLSVNLPKLKESLKNFWRVKYISFMLDLKSLLSLTTFAWAK